MLTETVVLQNIHQTRERMSAELLSLSPVGRAQRVNFEAAKIAEKYGLKLETAQ